MRADPYSLATVLTFALFLFGENTTETKQWVKNTVISDAEVITAKNPKELIEFIKTETAMEVFLQFYKDNFLSLG